MKVSRIAFYMHDLSGGGVERMRLALIDELRGRGIEVTLVLGNRAGALAPLLPDDLAVVDLHTRRTMAAIWPLAGFLRQACPDVLISSLDHNNIVAMLAGRLAGVGTRIVICQHSALSAERGLGWKYRAVPWLYWLLQPLAHGIVAVSRGVADDLAICAGLPRSRITPIYNPVIGRDFRARACLPPPHPWLSDKTSPVFVFVGRLTAQKDPKCFLDAMALLLQARPSRAILVGDGELLDELRADAARLGIADHIAFAGFQPNPLPWIRHADALVSCSRHEGLGNVLIEALACETPVIAADCPHGPFEILLGGLVGRLVPIGDPLRLAAAMDAQARCEPDRFLLRTRAKSFTARACADAHLALIEALPPPVRRPVRALGMTVSPLHARQVVDWMVRVRVAEEVLLIVTANLQHVRLLRDRQFAAAYAGARLVCPDGFPVMAYARWRGLALPVRVTGCDLFHHLARHPGLAGQVLFMVVESAATAAAVAEWAVGRGMAGQVHVAVAAPDLARNEPAQASLAARIRQAAPTILIMTLGAPLSEVFVHQARATLPPCWALCVGQAVRVELGLVARAPLSWQRIGCEWLWRLRQEPGRLWARYLRSGAWFPVAILRDIADYARLRARRSVVAAETDDDGLFSPAATIRQDHDDSRETPPEPAIPWRPEAPRPLETPLEAQIDL